jgi:signal transduction histidine kinase
MRNNFVADVSHEIKTPLSVIQGYADLLQSQDLSVEKRSEYTYLLSEAITSLTNLVTNILKLNKIENQGIIQKEKFSLDEQIRYCILSFEDKIEEKNIELNVDLDDVTVKSDRALLEIVWNNLISNAIKYTSYGGTVSIDLKKDKNGIMVRVADNGCGMSREMQKHIFDKFYQGDTSHSQEGNGLGLALVKQVVNMLNCKIEVESTLNKGSEFIVTI